MSCLDWSSPNTQTPRPFPPADPARRDGASTTEAGPVHPSPRLFRTFWCCGGTILFRDAEDRTHTLSPDLLTRVAKALWWDALAARGAQRTALCRIHAEAAETREDHRRWVAASSPINSQESAS